MQITFEFFGVLERLAGASALQLDLDDGVTVEDALNELAQKAPNLAETLNRSACAVGDTLVARSESLTAGTRLALLPPVAGG